MGEPKVKHAHLFGPSHLNQCHCVAESHVHSLKHTGHSKD